MSRVSIFWVTWNGAQYTEDEKVALRDIALSKGVEATAVDLLKENKKFIWLILLAIPICAALATFFDHSRNEFGRAIHITSAIIFGWAIFQVPIYAASMWYARLRCKIFLMSLIKYGNKPILCELRYGDGEKSELILKHAFTSGGLDDAADKAESQLSDAIKNKFEGHETWGLATQIIVKHIKESKAMNFDLAHSLMGLIAKKVEANPKYGDLIQVQVETDGSVFGVRFRDDKKDIVQGLGKIAIKW
jgi:hypothetical protein